MEEQKLVTAYTGQDGHKSTAFAKINYKVKENATGTATITLTNITISNTLGEKTTVEGNVTKTVTISEETQEPIPTAKTLTGITVTTKPTKTSYTEGENFDKTGMVVTASYSDGTSSEITNYTYKPNGELTTSDTKIVISYTEGSVTKTAQQDIAVAKKSSAPADTNSGNTINNVNVSNKDTSTANKVISQTGVTDTLVITILAIAIIGIVSYIKYKKYKGI